MHFYKCTSVNKYIQVMKMC